MKLPQPRLKGTLSFEEVLKKRRSIRDFSPEPLSLQEVSQILWAAQGITGEEGFGRSSPSAGALYPVEVYVVVRKVEGLEPGVYHYDVFQHSLEPVIRGEYAQELAKACLSQLFIAEAPVAFVIGAEYERVTLKYGERGLRYVYMEAGHCGQNMCLQAVTLGLAAVPIGAFWDKQVKEEIAMPNSVEPLYVIPVGHYMGNGS